MADDAFDEVLLREPVELAIDVGHEVGNLLLVDLHLLQVINHLIELLFANLLAAGYLPLFKLLANDALNLAHLDAFAQVDDGDAGASLAGSAGTAAAVGVALYIIRQTEVDNVRQVLYIESAGCHVGSDQELQMAYAELLHHQVALGLRELAMERVGVVTLLHQLIGNLLRLLTGAAEDDGVDLWVVVHDALQGFVFILGMDAIHHVLDVAGALVLPADGNLFGLAQVVLGDTGYFGAHRGGEEQRVALLRHFGQDGVDALGKAHVEHLVGFI